MSRALRERSPASETGLIGKSLVLGLIVLAALVVAAVDGGAIFITKTNLGDTADQAAFDGAANYRDTHSVTEAEQASKATATADGAHLVHFNLDAQTGAVKVTLAKTAPTFVIQRFSATRHWGQLRETRTSGPPP